MVLTLTAPGHIPTRLERPPEFLLQSPWQADPVLEPERALRGWVLLLTGEPAPNAILEVDTQS